MKLLRTARALFWRFTLREKAALVTFSLLFLIAIGGLFWNFYQENTFASPGSGGSLKVGVVTTIDSEFTLNPLFVRGNKKAASVEADIASLIFAGLMKYDPESGEISDHLATHTLSADKRTYTFTLKENLTWHDGAPLTADDVLFTYQTVIQNPEFGNALLRQAFDGVAIAKVDERTVTFTIPQPYKFFLTNFTIGLVPKHALELTPVANLQLDQFSLNPIGAGPYRFSGVAYEENSPIATLSLEAFPGYVTGEPHISLIDFQLFPSDDLLLRNIKRLDALRPRLKSQYEDLRGDDRFNFIDFVTPQYVAIFLNMDAAKLGGEGKQKLRLALQLATDKNALLEKVAGERIDTPLLETDTSEWFYEFSTEKSAGALKDLGWLLPGSIPTPPSTPEPEAMTPPATSPVPTELKYVYEPSKQPIFWTTTTSSYLIGSFPAGTTGVKVNGYALQLFNPANNRFSYKIDTALGTLKKGANVYQVEFFKGAEKLGEETATIQLVDSADQIPSAPVVTPTSTATEEQAPPPAEPEPVVDPIAETIRRTTDGTPLNLRMVTISTPTFYPEVAELLKQQWAQVGIDLTVEVLDQEAFTEKALVKKDYDLLLYGQNLGYNLDAFPFWHFSQAEGSGSNLSKYKSFEAGVLLEEIRSLHDDTVRAERLGELQELLKNDIPAIFLFRPTYTLPIDPKFQNVHLEHIALFPDEYANIEKWYLRESRDFHEGKNWWSFVPWFFSSIKNAVS